MEKVGGRKALTVAMAPHSMNAWDFQTSGHPSLIQDLLQTSPGAHPFPETALTSYCSSQPLLVQENNTSKNSIACNITTPQHHPNFFFFPFIFPSLRNEMPQDSLTLSFLKQPISQTSPHSLTPVSQSAEKAICTRNLLSH